MDRQAVEYNRESPASVSRSCFEIFNSRGTTRRKWDFFFFFRSRPLYRVVWSCCNCARKLLNLARVYTRRCSSRLENESPSDPVWRPPLSYRILNLAVIPRHSRTMITPSLSLSLFLCRVVRYVTNIRGILWSPCKIQRNPYRCSYAGGLWKILSYYNVREISVEIEVHGGGTTFHLIRWSPLNLKSTLWRRKRAKKSCVAA